MVKETEFYELLNVSCTAEQNDIKRSYRRLALRYHPDKNEGNAEASEMFKKISHAYEVLGDPEKREQYDKYGKDGLDGNGGGGFEDASDIFSMFFGGARRPRGEPRPKDLVHELPVTLEEMYRGKVRKVMVTRDRLCSQCSGSGLKAGAQRTACGECNGHGVQIRVQQLFPGFQQRVQMKCSGCDGSGERARPTDLCRGCRGQRIVKEKKVLEVNIEKGTRRNDVIRFSGEGNQIVGIKLSGDVLIFLSQQPHDVFRRVGHHLIMNYTITLQEALCGFEIPVEQLDGRVLLITVPAGEVISPEAAWCVSREGMPIPGTGGVQRGNLYINFKVEWPNQLPMNQLDDIASAFAVPKKQPLLGGNVVELSAYQPKRSARTTSRRNRQGSNAGRRARAAQFEADNDLEDDDDFGNFAGFSGASGGPQHVQCAQQ